MRTIRDEDNHRSEREPIVFKDVECKRKTPRAVLAKIGSDEVWVQESFLHDDNDINDVGDKGRLVVHAYGVSEKYNPALYAVAERLGLVE